MLFLSFYLYLISINFSDCKYKLINNNFQDPIIGLRLLCKIHRNTDIHNRKKI